MAKLTKIKKADMWTSVSVIFFALAVLWNQASGNQYGNFIGLGGLGIGIITLWRVMTS